ncbi:MAG: collagen-like triple helix repeat-containing protein [Bacillales bacterium]
MKKKNLLKCLALTSMLALSVGAVTSCGVQGEQGVPGKTGPVGPKGEPGEKGEKGSTYLPVIVLVNQVDGGVIAQDKYFIEVGDTFTLTFAPNTGKDILSSLTINGEEINLAPDATSYSYTAKEGDRGFQITSAKFQNINEFSRDLVKSYYDGLVKGDKGLASAKVAGNTIAKKAEGEGEFNTDSVLTKAIASVAALQGIDFTGKTSTQKVALVKEKWESEKAKVSKEYNNKINAAKANVKAEIENLYGLEAAMILHNTHRKDALTDEQKNSLKARAEGLLNETKTLFNFDSLKKELNTLEQTRDNVIGALKAAEAAVVTKDGNFLVNETTTKPDGAYTKLKQQLNDLGISTENMPHEVYEKWLKTVAEEVKFEKTSKDDATPKHQTDGVKEISEAYNRILTGLKVNLIEQYHKEVDKATSFISATARENCKGKIETIITGWFEDTTVPQHNITELLSLVGPNGCRFRVEDELATNYSAFNNERLGWKKTEVEAKIKATKDDILAKDKQYALLLKGGAYATPTESVIKAAEAQITTLNGLGNVLAILNHESTAIAAVKTAHQTALRSYLLDLELKNESTSKKFLTADGADKVKCGDLTTLVEDGANFHEPHATGFVAGDKDLFEKRINKLFKDNATDTFDKARDNQTLLNKAIKDIKKLNAKYKEYYDAKKAADIEYANYVDAAEGELVRKAVKDAKVELLKGNTVDIAALTNSFESKYEESLVSFKQETINSFELYYQHGRNVLASKYQAATLTEAEYIEKTEKLRVLKLEFESKLGNKVEGEYDYTASFKNYKQWLADFKAVVDPVIA